MAGQNHRNPRNKHPYLHESAATNLDWALEPNDRWISAGRRVPINLIQHAWPIRGYATMSVVSWLDIGRFTCNWTRNNRWESWHARRANTAVSLCSIVRTSLWRTSKGIKTMRSTVDRELVPSFAIRFELSTSSKQFGQLRSINFASAIPLELTKRISTQHVE